MERSGTHSFSKPKACDRNSVNRFSRAVHGILWLGRDFIVALTRGDCIKGDLGRIPSALH